MPYPLDIIPKFVNPNVNGINLRPTFKDRVKNLGVLEGTLSMRAINEIW